MRKATRRGILAAAIVGLTGTASYATASSAYADTNTGVKPKAEKTVPHTYRVQETSYWCSAASAQISLSARDISVDQSELASYMGVTPDVGLPNIANLRDVLNDYTGGAGYKVKQWSSDAELTQKLTEDVIYNVDGGYTVVLNVTRIADAEFPAGHYAPIVGYRDGGAEFLIADPSNSARQSIWLSAGDVVGGVKLYRYVA
ncbi:MAG TPA: C39 family peptidase [Candidatus Stackebrandtia faecavium]|nr:C39 family peptidase [Candidatus Stackebrandtia faecavium]